MSGTETHKSRKRSRTEKEEKPTRSGMDEVREEESPDTILLSDSSGGRDLSVDGRRKVAKSWDDIGNEEEMYLASTREELYELVMKRETYKCKVKEKYMGEIIPLLRSLLEYGRENTEELHFAMPEEREVSPEERSSVGRFSSLVFFQHKRITWMVETVIKRYLSRSAEFADQMRIARKLGKENAELRKSLEEVVTERDELLAQLVPRRTEVREVGVSTETEVLEVEMEDDWTRSLVQGFPRDLVGTLETLIERKMGEFLSQVGLSMEREREDSVRPSNTGKTLGPQWSYGWSGAEVQEH